MDNNKQLVKTINKLLNFPKTRRVGLKLLSTHLLECEKDDFVEYCINWMQNCCKSVESSKETHLAIETLSLLFKISANYPELNKPISFFITNRFFDHFFKYFKDSSFGWNCMKNCFLCYKGPCGPFQENIEKHLTDKVKEHKKISKFNSDCIALLPSLGGGGNEGINHKTNWINQFAKYIHLIHSILNELFVDIIEIKEYDTAGLKYISLYDNPTFDYLIILLYNHCSIVCSMLLSTYPTPKCISTNLIMEVICRGLLINISNFSKSHTTFSMSLKKVLPEIYTILLKVLNTLVAVCGNQLLPYSTLICKFIKQALEWTGSEYICGKIQEFENLRILVYNTICNWLVVTKSGSNIHSIANSVIFHIIKDIELKIEITSLKGKQGMNDKQETRHKVYSYCNECLCYSALRALECLLKFYGVLLRSEDLKHLQESVIKLLINLYKKDLKEAPAPYNSSKCRKSLFSVLLELVIQASPRCLPPTQCAFFLFKKGENDNSLEVSQFCSSSLSALTVIIHQQFSNGPFFSPENDHLNSSFGNKITEEIEPLRLRKVGKESDVLLQESIEIQDKSVMENKTKQTFEERSDLINNNGEFAENKKDKIDSLPKIIITTQTSTPSQSCKEMNMEVCKTFKKILQAPLKNQIENTLKDSNHLLERCESFSKQNKNDYLLDLEDEPNHKKCKTSEDSKLNETNQLINKQPNLLQQSIQSLNKPMVVENKNTEATGSETEIDIENSFLFNHENLEVMQSLEKEESKTSPKAFSSQKPSDKQAVDELQSKKIMTHLNEEINHLDSQKRYFLRSKRTLSGDLEETLNRTNSLDSLTQKPNKNLRKNTSVGQTRRPKTRASSKLDNDYNEQYCMVKIGASEEDEILAAFNESTE